MKPNYVSDYLLILFTYFKVLSISMKNNWIFQLALIVHSFKVIYFNVFLFLKFIYV